MNYLEPINFDVLIEKATTLDLYVNLINQINKDFTLSNESLDIDQNVEPLELFNTVEDKIFSLLQYRFSEYLNLLYIIDISEEEIKKLDGSDISKLASLVTFLILKREWQKVWFKKFY